VASKSLAHWKAKVYKASPAFALGSAVHALVLEPEKSLVLRGPEDRRGNKWKEAQLAADLDGKILLTEADFDLAEKIAEETRAHPVVARYLIDKTFIAEATHASGLNAARDSRVHLGLGEADTIEALRVSGFSTLTELLDLADWLVDLLGPEDKKGKRKNSPRIRDLHKLALAHYFHPDMLGRTSIKAVLPTVWRHSSALWENPWFAKYYQVDASGQAIDPYKTLPELPLGEDEEDEDSVIEGTGAIRIYQELIFLQGLTEEFQRNRETLLKQYCELDTAAMVMIWRYWSTTRK
jgi:hypothetical protein